MTRTINRIYCSTGAFISGINGRNHRLIAEYGSRLNCDGFELMIYQDWYQRMDTVIYDLRASELAFPVIHADKRTGDLISAANRESSEACFELFKRNCNTAAEVGSEKIVLHIWGVPDSDKHIDRIFEDYRTLMEIADSFDLDMLVENCVCINKDPLTHFSKIIELNPDCGFVIDTRPAAFHGQLTDMFQDGLLWGNGHVRHIHINDYKGGLRDWTSLRPILQPGKGEIDFERFFSNLKAYAYTGSITLEAPSMLPDGVDISTLNTGLDFIRTGMSL